MSALTLRLTRIRSITPRTRQFTLASCDGTALPAYTPGAHVEIEVRPQAGGRAMHRAYSLLTPHAAAAGCYEIAVQHEPEGSGGSRWMHGLQEGALLQARLPANQFELGAHAAPPLLLAAGIGITPILCMARALAASGQAFELHYLARQRDQAAYGDEVEALPGARCWFDEGDPARGPDLAALIGPVSDDRHLYVCGPQGLIAAVRDTAAALGWPEGQVHYELFAGSLQGAGDGAFTVAFAGGGAELLVQPGQSVMEAMEAAGMEPLFDCRRGECGICAVRVASGDAEHRDSCLSDGEHAAGQFCTCVSRARSDRLVLEI
ncbi:MAG: PDR/VanB family oxidoreductase [Comamonas sp.]